MKKSVTPKYWDELKPNSENWGLVSKFAHTFIYMYNLYKNLQHRTTLVRITNNDQAKSQVILIFSLFFMRLVTWLC
jgi:hypothetical protein